MESKASGIEGLLLMPVLFECADDFMHKLLDAEARESLDGVMLFGG